MLFFSFVGKSQIRYFIFFVFDILANMQLPRAQIIKARKIFERIYKKEKIDLRASSETLKDQLNLYLDHIEQHIKKDISPGERSRITKIIERNNLVSEVLSDSSFKEIVQGKMELSGKAVIGYVFCIDGRIPSIFLGDRFAKFWEVPAGELVTVRRKSDGKLLPASTDLGESLRRRVTSGKELLEIVFAHTSFIDPKHGCGAMAAKRAKGILNDNLSNEEANLKILEEKTIPAITNLFNNFRTHKGFEPLKRVGVSALYDTDSFGVILNYDRRDQGRSLSTTELTNQFKEIITERFIGENLVFGAYKQKFHDLKYLTIFFGNLLKITKALLQEKKFVQLQDVINKYLNQNYSDLTSNQKKAFRFFLTRSIALQYLTGLSAANKKNIDHPFAEHEEEFMAVSIRGATIGKFDPESQGFSSTPADAASAITNIKSKMSIMNGSKDNKKRPFILFICNLLYQSDLQDNNRVLKRAMVSNAELLRAIVEDPQLGEMVRKAHLIPVPVLLAEGTNEVLKIADHSAYI